MSAPSHQPPVIPGALADLYTGMLHVHRLLHAHGMPAPCGAVCVAGRPVTIEALDLDPVSGRLFLAFIPPYRLRKRTTQALDVNDGSVAAARLDLDAQHRPLALEIKPKVRPC